MIILVIFFAGLAFASGNHNFFYRRDYTYVEEFDAFYKVHLDPKVVSWTDAFKACDDEGAKLFYPKGDLEWTVVKNLTYSLREQLSTENVIIGISDQYGFGEFVNVDGHPASIDDNKTEQYDSGPCCIYMNIDTGVFKSNSCDHVQRIPFICKKVDETPCPTVDLEYVYNKDLRKCYKVHNSAKTWQEAYHTCYLEGAMLAVVDNESEANHIYKLVDTSYRYHTGFSKIDGDYYTVTGKRLEKVYRRWQPNHGHVDACGAVEGYNDGLYIETVQCNESHPFLCEMNAKIEM